MRRIYLDYAATTPVDPSVFAAMQPYFTQNFGNPGSLHFFGQEAMAAIDRSRETITRAIGADFRELIFTGSATEANNLALRGTVRSLTAPRIITTAIEHESILETLGDMERRGAARITVLPVSRDGFIDLEQLKNSLDENVILVSVMYANNEIGTIQPISAIAEVIGNWKLANKKTQLPAVNCQLPFFHTDATQAFQYLDCDVNKLGVDLMTLSGHKIYGPKGVGALYVRNVATKTISPIITGGGQEFGLRSGTENVPLIIGLAQAVELAVKLRNKEAKKILLLRDYFWKGIKKVYPKARLNGPPNRLPNNLNIYFPGKSAQDLLVQFDLAGIAVSSGSACAARSTKLSHTLQACDLPLHRIKSSLRITLGRPTTKKEIDEALKRIAAIV